MSATTNADIQARVEGKTIPDLFLATIAEHGDAVALRWKNDDDSWGELTYADWADQIARVADGLRARGVGHGDRVMLMLRNTPEFHVADVACLFLGATPVSIYNSSHPEQVAYLTNKSQATTAIVEDVGFLEAFLKVRDELDTLRHICLVKDPDGVADPDSTWADLMGSEPLDLVEAAKVAQPGDLATVIYTSGTTGPSKGVMLDHNNIAWTIECLKEAFPIDEYAGKRVVSYLPMAHIAERMTSHYMMLALGYEVTTCPVPGEIAAYAGQVHPNLIFGVPRVWEKVYAGVNAALAADPEKKKAVDEALETAAPIAAKLAWGTATDEEKATYDFLDEVAFSTIRGLVGLDQVDAAITGAAPIPADMLAWFRTIGINLSEIYGLSETSGPMTWEATKVKPGYVGVACPGVEVKLNEEDGEVLCRGGNVFRGYLDDPEKTAEVLDADGWFHSGDIGEFDEDGYLKIVDRKKELIITAGGKNLSPSNLEARLKMIPLVGQACAIGDQRPFVSALLVLDADVAPGWAAERGISYDSLDDLAQHADVRAEIEAGLPAAMEGFNNAEKVKKITILGSEWMPDSELLTPTSKLKRRGIHEHFAEDIEAMYAK